MEEGRNEEEPLQAPPERRRALTGPCDHCGACESCQWRGGPPEKPKLCNACGIRLRNHNSLELPSRKNAWTEDEERALREGVERHGSGRWEHIKTDNDFSEILSLRSNHALYDRWRNVLVARGELKWGSKKRRKQRQREGGSPSSGGGAEAPHTPPQLGGGHEYRSVATQTTEVQAHEAGTAMAPSSGSPTTMLSAAERHDFINQFFEASARRSSDETMMLLKYFSEVTTSRCYHVTTSRDLAMAVAASPQDGSQILLERRSAVGRSEETPLHWFLGWSLDDQRALWVTADLVYGMAHVFRREQKAGQARTRSRLEELCLTIFSFGSRIIRPSGLRGFLEIPRDGTASILASPWRPTVFRIDGKEDDIVFKPDTDVALTIKFHLPETCSRPYWTIEKVFGNICN